MNIAELWLVAYKAKAYRDKTGAPQSGYVVKERVAVVDTGKQFDVDDGYNCHKSLGHVFKSRRDDRTWNVFPETVDYSGG